MTSQAEQNVEDVRAILEDCVRMQQLAQTDFESLKEELDPWLMLPHPSGNGSMFTSKVSSECLWRLAERARASQGLERRVTLGNVKDPLQGELVKRFISEGRQIDEREVSKLLSWAAKAAKRGCKARTYYLPVRFTFSTEPEFIRLGPVTLMTREHAGVKLAPAIREYLKDDGVKKNQKWSRKHLREGLSYYQHFKWVAEVTIIGCDADTGENAARKAVSSAIDLLHVILSRRYTNKLRVGGPGLSSDKQSRFVVDGEGKLSVSTSHGGFDQVGFADGWSKELEREDIAEMFRLAGIALQCRSDITISRPISERYLDAAIWFGEAVRDETLSSRAVKYVTAIERIVTAGKTEAIEQTVATRTADLLFNPDDPDSWEENRQKVMQAYQLRSQLVHGSISPYDEGVASGVSLCGDLAEELLIATLHRFGDETLQFDRISNRQYAAWFESVREYVGTALHQLLQESAG